LALVKVVQGYGMTEVCLRHLPHVLACKPDARATGSRLRCARYFLLRCIDTAPSVSRSHRQK
jgi:hypothetical protein